MPISKIISITHETFAFNTRRCVQTACKIVKCTRKKKLYFTAYPPNVTLKYLALHIRALIF